MYTFARLLLKLRIDNKVGYQPNCKYQARYQPEGRADRAAKILMPDLIQELITEHVSLERLL